MKHLKRKFTGVIQLDERINDVLNSASPTKEDRAYVKENMGRMNACIVTDRNEVVQAFVYTHNGKHLVIPEADPVIIHFNAAIANCNYIIEQRPKLLSSLQDISVDIGINTSLFYDYFAGASATITFLYNALEAFINRLLPEDFTYSQKGKLRNKEQIQRYVQMEEKIKCVIPEALGKAFPRNFLLTMKTFKNKNFRDEIIHTKSNERSALTTAYKSIYTLALDFDYASALHSIRDYINFHKPNLIEECSCKGN